MRKSGQWHPCVGKARAESRRPGADGAGDQQAGPRLRSGHSSGVQCSLCRVSTEPSAHPLPHPQLHTPHPHLTAALPCLSGAQRMQPGWRRGLQETLGTPEARNTAQSPLSVTVYTSLVHTSGSENGMLPGGVEPCSPFLGTRRLSAVGTWHPCPPPAASPAASTCTGPVSTARRLLSPQGAAKCSFLQATQGLDSQGNAHVLRSLYVYPGQGVSRKTSKGTLCPLGFCQRQPSPPAGPQVHKSFIHYPVSAFWCLKYLQIKHTGTE